MGKKLTEEEFISRVNKINPNLKIIGKYQNSKTKVECMCALCNETLFIQPAYIFNTKGHVCKENRCKVNRKTHEEYLNELRLINPNVELLEEYHLASEKIKCKCKICGHTWNPTPSSLLNEPNCPLCIRRENGKKNRKTQDEFLKELSEINPHIKPLEKYTLRENRIKVQCRICGHQWNPIANSILNGTKCPECTKLKRRKTTKQFIDEMKEINNTIKIIGNYVKTNVEIECKCKLCGCIWKKKPSLLLKGSSCPKCSKTKYRSHDTFVEEMHDINPNIEIMSKFCGIEKYIDCKCKICGNLWTTKPQGLLKGSNCPVCANKKRTNEKSLSHDSFIQRMKEYHPNIKILGKYVNNKIRIRCKCEIDGYEWTPLPSTLNKSGCPVCANFKVKVGVNDIWTTNPELGQLLADKNDGYIYTESSNKRTNFKCPQCGNIQNKKICNVKNHGLSCTVCSDGVSMPNKFMANILFASGLIYESEKTFEWSNGKRYDFYIEQFNTIIEMNGAQHYKEGSFHKNAKSLEEQQRNDKYKLEIALKNGITDYIVIDCTKTTLEYMSNSVINELKDKMFINIKEVNLNQCYLNSSKSLLVETCKLWSDGYSKEDIMDKLRISSSSCLTYLRTGGKIGICAYTPRPATVSVICLNTNEIFDTMKKAQVKYNTNNIHDCCKGRKSFAGIHPITNEKLQWMYYKDYLQLSS